MRLSKKLAALAVGTIATVAVAGGAYAYWTAGGTGGGTAVAGSTMSVLEISGNPANGIVPGGSVPVTVSVHNPNSSSSHIDVISATVDANSADCVDGDFSFDSIPANVRIAGGATLTFDSLVHMADTAANQNACRGATLTLTYSSTSL